VAKFVKGDVVVVPFPFSDLTQAKRRPALIVSVLEGDDLILSQVTSQFVKDSYAVSIDVKPQLSHNFWKIPSNSPLLKGRTHYHPPLEKGD